MKLGLLLSGGKDSLYAGYLAKKTGYELTCLITIVSENKESYMFHTPSINSTKKQSEVMNLPLIVRKTKGLKEYELSDLKEAIKEAIKKYQIKGLVTGAIESVYQGKRIQKICNELRLECFNPLWQKNSLEHLNDLIKNKFKVMLTGVFAYPLNESYLGRVIDKKLINHLKELNKKYEISLIGEGGEFESLVLNCPLFKKKLKIKNKSITGKDNSWSMEVELI